MRSIRRASCLVRASGSSVSYLPFGAGPRACIGASFAMQEMIIMLATIVRGFRLDVAPNHQTWPVDHRHIACRARWASDDSTAAAQGGAARRKLMQTRRKSG